MKELTLLTGCISLALATSLVPNVQADGTSYHEVGGDNKDFTLTELPSGVTAVKKIGTGTMTENGVLEGLALKTAQGKSVISSRAGIGFRHYRFKVERSRGYSTGIAVEYSELKLYNGETEVTGLRSGIAFDGKEGAAGGGNTYPTGQAPDKAVDGDTSTVYYDRRMKDGWTDADREKMWLQISFAKEQLVTSYDWARGNGDESPDRDPFDWRFQGSTDGVTWYDLDVRKEFTTTRPVRTFVGPFPCSYGKTARSLGAQTVAAGAEVVIDGTPATVKELSGGGSVTCTNGGFLYSTQGEVNQQNVRLSGDLRVLGGTWRVCGENTDAWYRFTFKKTYGNQKFQMAEIAFFDRDGERTGYGTYTKTTSGAAADLQPGVILCKEGDTWGGSGAECPECMFDGNLASGKCFRSKRATNVDAYLNDENDPATWFEITVRLVDGFKPICGYNFLSADNNNYTRAPSIWVVESSADGVTWTKRDEKNPFSGAVPGDDVQYTFWNNGVPWDLLDLSAPAFSLAAADVLVASNATLAVCGTEAAISRLSVDLEVGGGTITTFVPATNGAIYLTDARSGAKLPREGDILSVGTVVSPRNLDSWKVYFNGVQKSRRLVCKDGKLSIERTGLIVVVE